MTKNTGVHQAPEMEGNLTAGGHELPRDWLVRIVLIWSGYAVSMFAGNVDESALTGTTALLLKNPNSTTLRIRI